MGRKVQQKEGKIRMKKDPCRCSEHECKQMLFTNEVLRRSMKKLLMKVIQLKKQLGLLSEEDATPGAIPPVTSGGDNGESSQGGGQV